ncbi:MAG: hypothetical protein KA795_14870 [Burkholderiaceae bacterium]|nr:hypothetical protein [Burkholderiaceae bacterium]
MLLPLVHALLQFQRLNPGQPHWWHTELPHLAQLEQWARQQPEVPRRRTGT